MSHLVSTHISGRGSCPWGNRVTRGVTSLGQLHLWGSHISGDHGRSLGMGTVAVQQHLGQGVTLRAAEQTVLEEKCWPASCGR